MKSKKCFIRFPGALCLTLVCLVLSVWLLFTPNSFAGEAKKDVVEISQKDVPLVITSPGSYRLISNLTVSSQNVTAISIGAHNVTIDLNGFTISGPGKGVPGFGIANKFQLPGTFDNVVVGGGTVRNIGFGIHLAGNNNRVENVRVFETGGGIYVGSSGVISQCQVAFCTVGVDTIDGSMILNNTIYSNDFIGIVSSAGGPNPGGVTVMGNNVRLTLTGIKVNKGQFNEQVNRGNRIEGNTITQCGTGIDLSEGYANYFAKNLLQGNGMPFLGAENNIDGGFIDPALSNIILP